MYPQNNFLHKITKINNKYNILQNILLFFTILTVNFSSYVAFFDINSFMLIDLTSISKYIFSSIILFTLVSSSLLIFFLFIKNTFLPIFYELRLFRKKYIESIEFFFDSYLTKFFLTLFVFLYIYIGISNTLLLFLILILYLFINLVYSNLKHLTIKKRLDEDESEKIIYFDLLKKENINSNKSFYLMLEFYIDFISNIPSLFNNILISINNSLKKENFFKFIGTNIGLLIILFSLSLGIFRANYVKNNIEIKVEDLSTNYVLFLNTDNGILLYDKNEKKVNFIPWNNLKQFNFLE